MRLLFLGFVSARKGLDELLAAVLDLLATGCTGFELDIVGGEEDRGQLAHYRQLYRAAGLDQRVRFHGTRLGREKIGFLQRADIFVLPSRNESFGIANLEAMASGVPVVQPRWGAFPEVIDRTRGGLLCEPNDSASLAETLYSLWKNPELASDLGKEGSKRVREHYSVEQMAAFALEVYGSLMK